MKRILVIRHGAFGDIILCMGAFRAIRAHHREDKITALTTARFGELLDRSGYFDEVLIDNRPKLSQLADWAGLVRRLRAAKFDRVYDLQRNERTGLLFRAMRVGRRLEWSGVVRGASHFVPDKLGDRRHVCAKLDDQLRAAGLPGLAEPEISWLTGDIGRFGLPQRYALIVAGGAARRAEKRASAECFAMFAQWLVGIGIAPVLLGTEEERDQLDRIRALCPDAIDLSGRTGFGEIAELARGAVGATGNDTGAMHLIALAGCASLVLFSAASDAGMVAPRGKRVAVLRCAKLATLKAEHVIREWHRLHDRAA